MKTTKLRYLYSLTSLSNAKIECEGLVAVEAGVELFAIHEESAVVDRDLVAVARFLPLRTHHALGDVHLRRKGESRVSRI